MLIIIFIRALGNLLLPSVLKLFFFCLVAYGIGGVALAWGLSTLIGLVPGIESYDGVAFLLSGVGGVVLAWFMFPLFYPILVSFFDEKMVAVIEREDYPNLPPAQPPFWPTLANDVAFSLKALGLNLLCLPFYLLPFGFLLYYGLNGYLLGMQFFRIAAGKRMSVAEAEDVQKRAFKTIIMAGVGISFFSTFPVLNLAAPLLGVAVMVHLFHAHRPTKVIEKTV